MPYKASGPDGIPNIVLKKSFPILEEDLCMLFNYMLSKPFVPDLWKTFTIVVLKKAGKPRYNIPKAYRPIALLGILGKVLASVIAEDLSRPGQTTMDAVHYMTSIVKNMWMEDKVVSAPFLNVEGAFPNAVTERLLHNMQSRRLPRKYVNSVECMLKDHYTRLCFNNFILEPHLINNGIGQGIHSQWYYI